VAFYMIAFSQAFTPFFDYIWEFTGFFPDVRMISISSTFLLLYIIYRRGANIGVSALWIIVSILGLSLISFFLGSPVNGPQPLSFFETIEGADGFFLVFAIIFPAFTGLTAGVGLSGDLKNPGRSIPLGTVSATLAGMIIYLLVGFKLAVSAAPEQLASNQLIMSEVALWGPMILAGLACATLSSAIGSILIAPRTLQALAKDRVFPAKKINNFLSKGSGGADDPANATLLTAAFVLFFVSIGTIDFVAQIISMFFMITYGAVCMVSFLQHFAGNLSYQPTFRTKWYLSLMGAILCFFMMFQMSPFYAIISLLVMGAIYASLKSKGPGGYDLSDMVSGAFFQLTRSLRVMIQRYQMDLSFTDWRPSFISLTSTSFKRLAMFDILRWLSHYYGFGTYIHYIRGELSQDTKKQSKKDLEELVGLGVTSKSSIYVDTIVAPTFKSAVQQIVQMPGLSGMENNSILVEYDEDESTGVDDVIDACRLAAMMSYNICVLKPSEKRFGYKKNIHVWLTPEQYRNARLMTTMAYILNENPEWKDSRISIFTPFQKDQLEENLQKFNILLEAGEIPLSQDLIQQIQYSMEKTSLEELITEKSACADIIIMGFAIPKIEAEREKFFERIRDKDVLYVRAGQKVTISEIKTEQ
jgi:solute carrier family 12 (sodium/potassium/chloride transporter), member 2